MAPLRHSLIQVLQFLEAFATWWRKRVRASKTIIIVFSIADFPKMIGIFV